MEYRQNNPSTFSLFMEGNHKGGVLLDTPGIQDISASFEEKDGQDTSQNLMIHGVKKTIRVKKEDSAFVYFILESYEGITSYSTLEHQTGDAHRDLELCIPPDFQQEVDDLLKQLGDLVYEMEAGAQ